jgi:hypothetical protein
MLAFLLLAEIVVLLHELGNHVLWHVKVFTLIKQGNLLALYVS